MKSINASALPITPRPGTWRWWQGLVLIVLLGLVHTGALALSTDKDQPILIEADSVDIDDRQGISVYRGNVEVRQGSMLLTADKVTILHKVSKTKRLTAIGKPVKFRQRQDDDKPDIRGEALQAEYLTGEEELILTGEAVLFHGADSFRSDRITYDRKKALVKGGTSAKGKQRVQVTIEAK